MQWSFKQTCVLNYLWLLISQVWVRFFSTTDLYRVVQRHVIPLCLKKALSETNKVKVILVRILEKRQ